LSKRSIIGCLQHCVVREFHQLLVALPDRQAASLPPESQNASRLGVRVRWAGEDVYVEAIGIRPTGAWLRVCSTPFSASGKVGIHFSLSANMT
jgi:hypothetical protein